uniref:RNA-directed RNA polymerase C-terminal domain-containing protein n=1 Tax=Riboviria sp. TaxID=2585031 RepID=A0A8K1U2N4_9VIRU|nr:MAG: hypothetical protein 1 [Riboviria sp.]
MRSLNIMEDAYAITKRQIPKDFDTYSSFERALNRLDRSSTPGYPYNKRGSTIGDVLGFDGVWFKEFNIQSLWFDVAQLMDGVGWDDLIFNVFIKEEPHKRSKIEEGRWRLIIGMPLHFQVLSHMLFDFQNDAYIENAYYIPSQQGIKLFEGNWRTFVSSWKAAGYDIGLDKRAWDWTVTGWKTEVCKIFRQRMVYGENYESWCRLVDKAYEALYGSPVLMLSNGMLFKQLHPGIQKSGSLNTISDNSLQQVLDHILVCIDTGAPIYPLPVAVGDDTLQTQAQVADLDAYKRYGSFVKSATLGLEFVGMEFLSTGPVPVYLEKHLFKIPYFDKPTRTQYFDAMLRLYSYSPHLALWRRLAYRLDLEESLKSDAYYRSWFEYQLD